MHADNTGKPSQFGQAELNPALMGPGWEGALIISMNDIVIDGEAFSSEAANSDVSDSQFAADANEANQQPEEQKEERKQHSKTHEQPSIVNNPFSSKTRKQPVRRTASLRIREGSFD